MIPEYVLNTINTLEQHNHEAYIVGGCVRDLLMARTPKDWDIATNALPEQTLALFPDSVYENDFGTVLVKIKNGAGETEHVLEVTTYRSEQGYSDRRHPDEVVFETELDKDLERRDFTVNAIAMGLNPKSEIRNPKQIINSKFKIPKDWIIIDLFGGQKDLKEKIIRAVGEPADRFKEDALRMMRAVRFAAELGFAIEPKTERAIVKLAGSIKFVAKERIRDEMIKILASERPYDGIMALYSAKLLNYIIPELTAGVDLAQNHHHTHSVFKHSVLSLKECPSKEWQVRLAALLHDIGKPKALKEVKGQRTFYNHEYIGQRMTIKIMERLKFSTADIERVSNLVRNHMFYYNVGEVTAASVRRLIKKVGKENLKDLIDIRVGDRLGSGVKKAMPYKLRHLQYMFERVQNDPVSVKMLGINGDQLMDILKIPPGPRIGAILDVLLAEVLEDPALNDFAHLSQRSRELVKMELNELRERAKEKIEEKRQDEDQALKKDFYV